ncbi:Fe-S oxidoreductase [Allocatelliglobosispora scoriae]|uniref:Fe-S oxidoreductase n=1 Tax=Allocatelliglobosispora scoriae TaxID=643052 RepID=A0A841BTQ1_9ACTN|nr:(Fe-S)-binding protein [Allocatelliglobosispora scoriae]MBB5871075.1 Fe-S oxidoreductase [Allocatelliglobosispora scoriae]
MGGVQIVTATLALIISVVAVVLVARTVVAMVRIIKLGQPDPSRLLDKGVRLKTMLRETLLHTRMLRWTVVGAAHWFVFVAFGSLLFTLIEAYGEVVSPTFEIPIIGEWTIYGLVMEAIAALGLISILVLIGIRLRTVRSARNRFAGSTMWQAYYVEWTIFAIIACVFLIRGFKVATDHFPYPTWATPISHAVGAILPASLAAISITAFIKIAVSMAWFIVIALNMTMGVAWHRFAAFFNIFFKRQADGGQALGALKPMVNSEGAPLDFEEADPDKDLFGVGKVEDFTWKGLLDFSTCTECGRCQSQCPAWNTGKPLSPKLLIMSLRDHAYAKAPYLLAAGELTDGSDPKLAGVNVLAMAESERPLIGGAAEMGVIDPDVLWSCTTCGACVEQCPVDIEHVDHIVDMRRYQVMIESSFPAEAGVMLRNLENKGNPWGAAPNTREDWTKGLDFEVPKVADGAEFEYLFWVGCAGAFEDRAKKTTRAVATLLNEAGVSFAILGNNETCTGDPARRIGNEFVFQMLAQQNVETLKEAGVLKIVASCPHCFNTLGNEYTQLGLEVEVVHHTELLAHLVKTGKLTPVKQLDGGLTYHDPCYLGRHNRVFTPPREVLGAALGAGGDVIEMPRNSERSFCCGAGGARMWMEERIGKRINVERTEEAVATGAKTIAVGCPFCSTMITDGVNATGNGESVEVVDVATVLLRSLDK